MHLPRLLLAAASLSVAFGPQARAAEVHPMDVFQPERDLRMGALVGMADLSYVSNAALAEVMRLSPAEANLGDADPVRRAWSHALLAGNGLRLATADDLSPDAWDLLGRRTTGLSPHVALFVRPGAQPLYILAIRGSQAEWRDWLVNAVGFTGIIPSYYLQLDELVAVLARDISARGGRLVLTGHSLGGGMAEYAAGRHGLAAFTFNSAHLSQPFQPHPQGIVHTFHLASPHWWNYILVSDPVNALRLGGNFAQTRLVTVWAPQGQPLKGHSLVNFYRSEALVTSFRAAENIPPGQPFPNFELLESMPNLVAEVPPIVRDAVRRSLTDRSPVFDRHLMGAKADNERVDIWDVRFRVGIVHDSHPAAGLPVEDLRVIDPPTGATADADRAVSWQIQSSYSHPFSKNYAFNLNFGHRSFTYDDNLGHDLSLNELKAGVLRLNSRTATLALAGTVRNFKSVGGNLGTLSGVEAAYSTGSQDEARRVQQLFWVDASASALRRSGVSGGNGTVLDGQLGWRVRYVPRQHPKRSLAFQVRSFAGRRSASNLQFANHQWGGGLGLTFNGHGYRFFVEPAMRWTRYHLPALSARGLSDQDFILRAEAATELNDDRKILGHPIRVVAWELAAGYTLIRSRPAAVLGGYTRELISLQLSKRF